jgi:hypothetical protein
VQLALPICKLAPSRASAEYQNISSLCSPQRRHIRRHPHQRCRHRRHLVGEPVPRPDHQPIVMAHETSTTTHTTSKRKRGNLDHDSARSAPGYTRSSVNAANEASGDMQPYEVDDSAISQLIAHNQDAHPNGGNAPSASDTAAAALSHYQMGGAGDASFQTQGSAADASFGMADSSYTLDQLKDSTSQGPTSQQSPTGATSSSKPPVGSDEWHKVRRDNHKEGRSDHVSICLTTN